MESDHKWRKKGLKRLNIDVYTLNYNDIDQTDLRHKIRKIADRSEKISR